MTHPDTEVRFISKEMGAGLTASRPIPVGTIVWALDDLDRVFSAEEFLSMDTVYRDILDMYTFRNSRGEFILCWDRGKYVNHSFNPNCISTAYDFDIAVRDIMPGEQLTNDYGFLNIQTPFRGLEEGTRRKVAYPDDLPKYYREWDRKTEKVFSKIAKVEQPLRPFISDEVWNTIEEVIAGNVPMTSILNNYYRSEPVST